MHRHHDAERCFGHDIRAHHAHGRRGFGFPMGPHGFGPGRARRGDIRPAVLRLLAEKPMHGYQIIQELSSRSAGAWNPSAGSVYPTLQLLADEGLVTSEETSGKKVFSLTEAGTAEVAAMAEQPAPWEEAAQGASAFGEYREAAGRLVQVMFQIGKTGSDEQRQAALEVLNDARKKLYAILAED